MNRWTDSYSHGTLIDFDFVKHLKLREQVQEICKEHGWQYDQIPGDIRLFERLLSGDWPEADFLMVRPGQKVFTTNDVGIIGAAPA
jgi:hypothetical protein